MQALQCSSEVRDLVLLFVDKICEDVCTNDSATESYIMVECITGETLLPLDYSVPIRSHPLDGNTKQVVPKLYSTTGIVTLSLSIFAFIFMFIDAIFSLLELNSSVYIVMCLCCLSLFFTNKIALAEWKSINAEKRETFHKDNDT